MINPITTYSGGWKVKMQLACALLINADILMLDEPTGDASLQLFQVEMNLCFFDLSYRNAMINAITFNDFERLRDPISVSGASLARVPNTAG